MREERHEGLGRRRRGNPLQEIDQPPPEPQGTPVLVEVTHCGVCHSDVRFCEGFLDLSEPEKTRISVMGLKPPLTLGHEIVGKSPP